MSRPGKMTRRIRIELATSTASDDYGHPIETWEELATVWGEIVPKAVAERVVGPALMASSTDVFQIRYRGDVSTTQRISYGGRLYNINGIQEVGRQKGLMLTTTAEAA